MEKEDKIVEKAKPYFYDAGGNTVAIVVHGFSGTPYDLRELAKFLYNKGISVKAPLLAGHGRHWTDLEDTGYYDWWKTIEDDIKELSEKFEKVFLIGYSFGGNLSMDIAARYPDKITGIVTMGISVFLKKEALYKFFLPFAHIFIKKYRKNYVKKYNLKEYEETGSYVYVSTKSLYDFFNFIKFYTKKELHKVITPSLIIHSRDDSITHPLSSEYVYSRINSKQKELLMLDDVNHNPLVSTRRQVIFSRIDEFIRLLME